MKLKATYQKLSSEQRLYGIKTPLIGLTGGIATGKSTVAEILKNRGLPVINADRLVKEIYSLPETREFIQKNYPEVIKENEIQFPLLRKKVFTSPEVKSNIENFIYQLLPEAFRKSYDNISNAKVIVYDVPLLFEKKMETLFDLTLLVYAPRNIQRARLIKRDGHLESMADDILDQQIDIEEKKLKADFIIDNSRTEAELPEEVNQFLRLVLET